MKFAKGLLIGGLITTGIILMYNEGDKLAKMPMMKKGKKLAKKMGVM